MKFALIILAGATVILLIAANASRAQQPGVEIPGVKVDEHLNADLPLDLTFENEKGETVQLGDYFKSGKPVILQLSYYRCPNLCTAVSQGIVSSLQELTLKMGRDFQVVQVSIDPDETSALALRKKENSMEEFRKINASLDPSAWHLLVGRKKSVERLADVVGFRYVQIGLKEARQFVHPAVITVCTPDGRISRYLYGVRYPPQTLRLALVEASDGKVGTTVDKVILSCYVFDPNSGKYVFAAVRFMQISAVTTAVILGTAIFFWRRRGRRRQLAMEAAAAQQTNKGNEP